MSATRKWYVWVWRPGTGKETLLEFVCIEQATTKERAEAQGVTKAEKEFGADAKYKALAEEVW